MQTRICTVHISTQIIYLRNQPYSHHCVIFRKMPHQKGTSWPDWCGKQLRRPNKHHVPSDDSSWHAVKPSRGEKKKKSQPLSAAHQNQHRHAHLTALSQLLGHYILEWSTVSGRTNNNYVTVFESKHNYGPAACLECPSRLGAM